MATKLSAIKSKIYVFKFNSKNIMRKINQKSSDVDSFKYSILMSFFSPRKNIRTKTI